MLLYYNDIFYFELQLIYVFEIKEFQFKKEYFFEGCRGYNSFFMEIKLNKVNIFIIKNYN